MSWSKDFLLEFIELLREHEDYHNQMKRTGCYEVLLRKMKEVDPSADISKVQKKINNLRTVFRKELKKVESSHASGSGTDNIYVPKLWYYEKLMFLKDQEQPYGATSSSMDTVSTQYLLFLYIYYFLLCSIHLYNYLFIISKIINKVL